MTDPRPWLARRLDLAPHPEGGWYRETWRTAASFVPEGYPGMRTAASAVYFALHPGEESRWHKVRSDEVWLWHRGGPLHLRFGGAGAEPTETAVVTLGADLDAGDKPQAIVPGGVWQSAAPAGTEPVLVTCIVSPGFDFADFQMS